MTSFFTFRGKTQSYQLETFQQLLNNILQILAPPLSVDHLLRRNTTKLNSIYGENELATRILNASKIVVVPDPSSSTDLPRYGSIDY
jgi:hypothetical protein